MQYNFFKGVNYSSKNSKNGVKMFSMLRDDGTERRNVKNKALNLSVKTIHNHRL